MVKLILQLGFLGLSRRPLARFGSGYYLKAASKLSGLFSTTDSNLSIFGVMPIMPWREGTVVSLTNAAFRRCTKRYALDRPRWSLLDKLPRNAVAVWLARGHLACPVEPRFPHAATGDNAHKNLQLPCGSAGSHSLIIALVYIVSLLWPHHHRPDDD